ncbi:MAG TPA: TonB-dependent receptor [Methylophilaceae bacterium]|jgi:iron complex outermembrane receptor protein
MNKTLLTLACAAIAANASAETLNLNPVVVTATRVEQNSFDLPVAIDVVDKSNIQDGQLQATLSESLIRVPGITAQNRTQQAQDPQISSRGFGARSSFGVRGIRLYVDGIPLTMPDGQGQPGIVDLSMIKSIEVMRGPFSSLYGNSSGGVIQMFSEDAPKTTELGGSVMFGSYATKRQILNAGGSEGNFEYMLDVSNFDTDGYRNHSASSKQQATAKLKFNFSDSTKLTTLINWFDQSAQDPLGLTRSVAFTSPKSVVSAAINANTRVERSHTQVGFNLEHTLNESNTLNLMTYVGTRDNLQILPTNAAGTNARASQIARDFYGVDVRWDNKGIVFTKPYTVSLGMNYGEASDARLDTNVLSGGAPVSVKNRDEDNIARNFDQYAQAKLSLLDNVDVHAGLRHTRVNLIVKDRFTTGTGNNGDNSGGVEYDKTTPVIGATWKVNPALNLYANYGEGFETPTFIEAAYTSTSAYVPNLSLKPSQSKNYEIGAKAFLNDNTRLNATVFRTETQNELVVATIDGANRAIYANANDTYRQGLELSVDSQLQNNLSLYGAYTYLDAKFDSAFTSANGLIKSGNVISGTYRDQLYGELAWKAPSVGFSTAFEARYNSKVYVNDTNTDAAPSYAIYNIRAGFSQDINHWSFSEYVRVENIFDRDYIGSVRVNDSNARYFEPAAGRNYLVGLNAAYRF